MNRRNVGVRPPRPDIGTLYRVRYGIIIMINPCRTKNIETEQKVISLARNRNGRRRFARHTETDIVRAKTTYVTDGW